MDVGPYQHHPVWVLLTDLADEERTHARACATSQGVADLEACMFAPHVKLSVSKYSPYSKHERGHKRPRQVLNLARTLAATVRNCSAANRCLAAQVRSLFMS